MSKEPTRYWSDLSVGEVFNTPPITIGRREILEFAAEFDPQPYHLDAEAAEASIFGGLCASGWHVTAMMMRLLTDCFVSAGIDLLGASAVSKLRWRKPVFADDALTATITVVETTPPEDGAGFGRIGCDVQVFNQDESPVIALSTTLMIGRQQEAGNA